MVECVSRRTWWIALVAILLLLIGVVGVNKFLIHRHSRSLVESDILLCQPSTSPDGSLCTVWEMNYACRPPAFRLWLVGSGQPRVLASSNTTLSAVGKIITRAVWDPKGDRVAWLESDEIADYLAVCHVRTLRTYRRRLTFLPSVDLDLSVTHVPVSWDPSARHILVHVSTAPYKSPSRMTFSYWLVDVKSGSATKLAGVERPPSAYPDWLRCGWINGRLVYIDGGIPCYAGSPRSSSPWTLRQIGGYAKQMATDGHGNLVFLQKLRRHTRLIKVGTGHDQGVYLVLEADQMSAPAFGAQGRILVLTRSGTTGPWRVMLAGTSGKAKEIARVQNELHYAVGKSRKRTIVWVTYGIGRRDCLQLVLEGSEVVARRRFWVPRIQLPN